MARRVARIVLTGGEARRATRTEKLAAGVTGLVESDFRNLGYGHADSRGWRQERAKYFKNPQNVEASRDRFFRAARKLRGRGLSVGQLAQAVQKSTFPERYQQRLGDARRLLASLSAEGGGGTEGVIESVSRRTPPQVQIDAAGALRQALMSGSKNPLLAAQGLVNSGAFTSQQPGRVTRQPARVSRGGGTDVLTARANRISRAAPPYKWGGGHGATPAKLGVPVDCSGAVSQVLGIKPRVSGAFGSWGKRGPGPRGSTRVYYNGKHVLMEINGRFFGTSAANPGGGAGWIPRSKISRSYLRGFKVRHA